MKKQCLIIALCTIVVFGCGDSEANRSDSSSGSSKENDTKIQSGDDNARAERIQARKKDPRTATKRPERIPEDVPMYPYVKIILAPGAARATTVTLVIETEDALADVRSYYVDEYVENGWKTTHNAPAAIVVEKDGRKASVTLQTIRSATNIIMHYKSL